MREAAAAEEFEVVDSTLMKRVFYVFAALALLSVAISLGGKWLGRSIAMAGYTDDTTVRQVVMSNNVISVPANFIRFDQARRDGIASRLDLYLRYPEMDGYSTAARDDFNHATTRKIIFLSFEPRMMSRDMSGRFAPIYSALIVKPGTPGPGGTTLYGFTEKSGYLNEVLAVAERPGKDPFVARCLSGPTAEESLAPCERDIQIGDDLSLTYRFPRELLGNWQVLDAAIATKVAGILKTGR
ncbi:MULTISPECIES: hypothetical protein [unclassified Mesorhizobium]|uniref:hypothetical protein n=1 Tax=unclassified Mesorhizobium TaxID=325217 RepID=UPI000FCBC4FF|nr:MULTISPECIES: hypothetical protein [unclassified Mesorhizobium]RUV94125.1 hypothetical protein EOA49_29370 [Mesorhizobium sp. M1A.F.Ca.IN.020.04.1.1]RUW01709.1 hypothetical protein EOA53_30770 [Mesorhizobium sp. M1A.F.Ca.IN.020.03.1.1]RWF73880.1 MAG: hypothetical protein EOQ34_07285 [Mesorhizobium sp.]RWH10978.1 MAG: hypothetical protein EOQ74_23390 [Mesorhizobium sp.]RWN10787.1 MAG: hypothetical protein EOR87_17755 [Mesorhizobium sp.]